MPEFSDKIQTVEDFFNIIEQAFRTKKATSEVSAVTYEDEHSHTPINYQISEYIKATLFSDPTGFWIEDLNFSGVSVSSEEIYELFRNTIGEIINNFLNLKAKVIINKYNIYKPSTTNQSWTNSFTQRALVALSHYFNQIINTYQQQIPENLFKIADANIVFKLFSDDLNEIILGYQKETPDALKDNLGGTSEEIKRELSDAFSEFYVKRLEDLVTKRLSSKIKENLMKQQAQAKKQPGQDLVQSPKEERSNTQKQFPILTALCETSDITLELLAIRCSGVLKDLYISDFKLEGRNPNLINIFIEELISYIASSSDVQALIKSKIQQNVDEEKAKFELIKKENSLHRYDFRIWINKLNTFLAKLNDNKNKMAGIQLLAKYVLFSIVFKDEDNSDMLTLEAAVNQSLDIIGTEG